MRVVNTAFPQDAVVAVPARPRERDAGGQHWRPYVHTHQGAWTRGARVVAAAPGLRPVGDQAGKHARRCSRPCFAAGSVTSRWSAHTPWAKQASGAPHAPWAEQVSGVPRAPWAKQVSGAPHVPWTKQVPAGVLQGAEDFIGDRMLPQGEAQSDMPEGFQKETFTASLHIACISNLRNAWGR